MVHGTETPRLACSKAAPMIKKLHGILARAQPWQGTRSPGLLTPAPATLLEPAGGISGLPFPGHTLDACESTSRRAGSSSG